MSQLTVSQCEETATNQLIKVMSNPASRWLAIAVEYDEETKTVKMSETSCQFPVDQFQKVMNLIGQALTKKTIPPEPEALPVANLE